MAGEKGRNPLSVSPYFDEDSPRKSEEDLRWGRGWSVFAVLLIGSALIAAILAVYELSQRIASSWGTLH